MKIALTVWGNRISPVFDAARTLLVAEIQNKQITNKTYIGFSPDSPQDLIETLKDMGISVMICGAISNTPAGLITEKGIKLLSFVTGNAASVLDSFAGRQELEKRHLMPGCSKACCQRARKNPSPPPAS
ncbi:MAG: dinitrogenase iron-molybdenum cofactor biosynthesis domain-containing protein [Desulfobacterales bacterium]|nr:dinitrogenase iron-molybdenum cofactor biosynthesis domain-containing protein [Desulfobacterales bacterium]